MKKIFTYLTFLLFAVPILSNETPSSVETSDEEPPTPQKLPDVEEALVSSLIERNPFGKTNEQGMSQQQNIIPEAPKGLEFRSIYCIDKKWTFGIYDGALKKHYSIPLGKHNDESLPYVIDFYDDETNSISISDKLGTYTLTLKEPDRPRGTLPNMSAPSGSKTKAPAPTNRTAPIQNAQQKIIRR